MRARRAFIEQLEDRRLLAVVGSFDFSDDQGLATSDGFTTNGPANQWHVSVGRESTGGHSAANSFYFGSGEGPTGGGTYNDNANGSLLSPMIDLTNTVAARLNFNHFLQVEPGNDFATVSVIHSSGSTVIARSGTELANSNSVFVPVQLDLSRYVGQSIQLEFNLTSNGSVVREGWYIDDVVVTTANAGTWTSEGPFAATDGQVENNIPSDQIIGAIHTVLAHPTDPNTLYVGGTNGGVWKTTNATDLRPNWVPLTDNLPSLSIGAMAFDTADPTSSTIYAGTGRYSSFARIGNDRVGLYKSTDGGQTWTILNDKLAGANISGIVAHGSNVVVSVNTADTFSGSNPASFSKVGIFRSTDGGSTFTQVSNGNGLLNGLPGGVSYDLVVDPINPNILYTATVFSDLVGGINGVYKSTNFGETWFKTSSLVMDEFISSGGNGLPGTSNLELAVGHHNEVYAAVINNGGLAGLFRSDNGGGVWTQMDSPSTNENGVDVGLNPSGGKGPAPSGNPTPEELAGGQGAIHFSILADPDDANIVYVAGDRQPRTDGDRGTFPNSIGAYDFSGRVFRGDASKASGSQFVHLTHSNVLGAPGGGTAHSSSPHADSREMAWDAAGNLIEVDDGGIYRRTSPKDNTGDWFGVIGNLQTTEAHDIAYDTVSNTIITGNQDTGSTYQSSAGAQTWVSISTADGGDVAVDDVSLAANNQSIRYSSFQNLGAFRKTVFDGAGNVVSQSFPALSGFSAPAFVTPVVVNAIDPTRLAFQGTGQTFESFDQGDSVVGLGTAPNIGIAQDAIAYGGYRSGQANPNVLWVGSYNDVYVRTGNGPLQLTAPISTTQVVRDLSIDPYDWSNAFVTTASSVFVTDDVGNTWDNITGNLSSLATSFYSSVYVATGLAEAIVVGTNRGVFASLASSLGVWVRLGDSLPNSLAFDLDYDAKDDVLVVGTLGRGAWKLTNVTSALSVSSGVTSATLDANNSLVIRDVDGNYPDNLTIQSDTANNRYVISGLQQTIQTTIAGATGNGTTTVTIPFSAVTGSEIRFDTLNGSDELTVDFSLGTFSKPINYRSGAIANDQGNSLRLIGGNRFANATYDFNGPGSGTITVSGNAPISYIKVEPIQSELLTTDTVLNYNDDAGTLVITGAGLGVNGLSVGSAVGEGLSILLPSKSLVIDGSQGTNVGAHLTGAIELDGTSLSLFGNDINLERAVVATKGNGSISLTASDFVVLSSGSRLSTTDGDITVLATGTAVPGSAFPTAILLEDSTLTSINGDITVDGIAITGDALGVALDNDSLLQSTGAGKISLSGTGVGAGPDILVTVGGGSIDASTGTGDVMIVADQLAIDDVTSISGTGQLLIKPRTVDISIGVGGSATGTLVVSDKLISKLADGFAEITIGDEDFGNGDVAIDQATFTDSITIVGGTIDVQQLTSVGNTIHLVATTGEITDSLGSGDVEGATIVLDGEVSPGSTTGLLDLAGDVLFSDASELTLEIGGQAAGPGANAYEQLVVTGMVAIGSQVALNLVPTGGFVPSLGDAFVIVSNDSTDAVTGTFAGLPQGAVIRNFLGSGLSALVDYNGGSGNDIVLSVLPELTLALSPTQISETNGRATVTATLSSPAIRPVTITLNLSGTATQGTDYNSGTLIAIPVGRSTGSVTILTVPDQDLEYDETIIVDVASAVNAITVASRSVTATIVDDDFLAPVISTSVSDPTNLSVVPVQIDFGGSVTLFDVNDIQVTNASVGNLTSLGGGSYTVEVSPINDGEFTVFIASGAAFDFRFTGTRSSNQLSLTSDRTSPTPTISSQVTLASLSDFDVTIDFGEPVVGFVAADLDVSNGSVSNLVDNGNGVFVATITALSDGDVTIGIAAAKANDEAGNDNLVSNSLVISVDTVPPVLTVPANIAIEANTVNGALASTPSVVNFLNSATATDAIDPDVSISNDAPAVLALGANVITFTAIDDAGNVTRDSATIIVADTTRPQLTVPAAITVEGDTQGGAAKTNASITAFLNAATATDVADASVDIQNDAPVLFPLGTTTVTFIATDDSGNATSKDVIVTVVDTVAPSLNVPAPVKVEGNQIGGISSTDPAIVAFLAGANATDIVSSVVQVTNNAPPVLVVGTNVITFTATDASGNTVSAQVDVNVTDSIAPVISVATDVTVQADAFAGTSQSNPLIQAFFAATTATDKVDASVTLTNDAPAFFPLGSTVVRFTARDDSGNQTTASATVTVVDTIEPGLTTPADITVEADAPGGVSANNSAIATFLGSATALDIADPVVTITNDAPAFYTLGDTLVTFTATDDAGNQTTGTATVTVVDTTAPSVQAPASIQVEGDTRGGAQNSGAEIAAFLSGALASDAVDTSLASVSNDAPTVFPLGVTEVSFFVQDASGNRGMAKATVTVVDTTAAIITAPAGLTLEADTVDGASTNQVAFTDFVQAATAVDIVDASPRITTDAPAVLPLGDTIVTFTAEDASGNVSTTNSIVRVADTTPPVLSVPASIVIEGTRTGGASASDPAVIAFFNSVTASDNVDSAPVLSNDAPTLFPFGSTVITFTATDSSGNQAMATSTIQVVDTMAPTLFVPASITVEADTVGGVGATNPEIVAFLRRASVSDVVDSNVSLVIDSPNFYGLGDNDVTFSATDAAGNQAEASSSVTVVDTTPPTLALPVDISIQADTSGGTTIDNPLIADFLASITATDIADASPTVTNNAPALFPIGDTVITFTATDASGNVATVTGKVHVDDQVPPTLTVPEGITLEGDVHGGTTSTRSEIVALIQAATATDTIDPNPVITTDALKPFIPLGVTILTYHAQDASGNVATATTTITVVDTTPPALTIPADLTVAADSETGVSATLPAITQYLAAAKATDIVEVFPVLTNDAPSVFPIGSTVVTFTAHDASGNEVSQTGVVTVSPLPGLDFGDAPSSTATGFASSYPTLLANDGARHVVGALTLGSTIDSERDGQPNATATGDGSDEDGVTVLGTIVSAGRPTTSSFQVTASQPGKLDAWIDFNRDGDWNDANEKIANSVLLATGENLLAFSVPAGASPGTTFARFRLSTSGGLTTTGEAADGEVEDYQLLIVNGNSGNVVGVNVQGGDVVLSLDAAGNIVTHTGPVETFRAPAASVGRIDVQANVASSSVTLDFASGLVIPAGGLGVDGGVGSNTLEILGGSSTLDLTNPLNSATNFATVLMSTEVSSTGNSLILDATSVLKLAPDTGIVRVNQGPSSSLVIKDAVNWQLGEPVIQDGLFLSVMTNPLGGNATIITNSTYGYHNFLQPGDINNDGSVTSNDALQIIYELNTSTVSDPDTGELQDPSTVSPWPGLYFDRNADNRVTALDALIVINDIYLNDLNGNTLLPESESIVSDFVRRVDASPLGASAIAAGQSNDDGVRHIRVFDSIQKIASPSATAEGQTALGHTASDTAGTRADAIDGSSNTDDSQTHDALLADTEFLASLLDE